MISLSAVGFAVPDEAAGEAARAVEAAGGMLAALFPAVLAAFGSGCDDVALPLLPFMSAYVARLKGLARRPAGLSPDTLGQVGVKWGEGAGEGGGQEGGRGRRRGGGWDWAATGWCLWRKVVWCGGCRCWAAAVREHATGWGGGL